jgi:hypothetical protein
LGGKRAQRHAASKARAARRDAGGELTPARVLHYAAVCRSHPSGDLHLRTMNACTLNLRHAADASRIDAAVRACVAGLLSCRALRASSLLLSLPIGCRA